MTDHILITLAGSRMKKSGDFGGVTGEGNATALRIVFDESWDGLAKKVTFWDAAGANPVARTLTADLLEDLAGDTRTYLCPIPPEALKEPGRLAFVVDGYADGVRGRSAEGTLRVDFSPMDENAGTSADPTPSQAEQLQAQIDTLLEDISAQAEAAQTAAGEAADSLSKIGTSVEECDTAAKAAQEAAGGAQDGAEAAERARTGAEDAAKSAGEALAGAQEAQKAIEDMTVSAETLDPGSPVTVTKTVEEGVVNLHYAIPRGEQGRQGETGGTGAQGDPGLAPRVRPRDLHWEVYDPDTGSWVDTGVSASTLLDGNTGQAVRVWYGTIEEYNALPVIEPDVLYNILEGVVPV